jgi:hypothetical protein
MMDELVNRVTAKTGLSQDQATAAVESVLGLLKEKLPAPLASHLDSLVGGGQGSAEAGGEGLAGKASAMLGNMFGNKS